MCCVICEHKMCQTNRDFIEAYKINTLQIKVQIKKYYVTVCSTDGCWFQNQSNIKCQSK